MHPQGIVKSPNYLKSIAMWPWVWLHEFNAPAYPALAASIATIYVAVGLPQSNLEYWQMAQWYLSCGGIVVASDYLLNQGSGLFEKANAQAPGTPSALIM